MPSRRWHSLQNLPSLYYASTFSLCVLYSVTDSIGSLSICNLLCSKFACISIFCLITVPIQLQQSSRESWMWISESCCRSWLLGKTMVSYCWLDCSAGRASGLIKFLAVFHKGSVLAFTWPGLTRGKSGSVKQIWSCDNISIFVPFLWVNFMLCNVRFMVNFIAIFYRNAANWQQSFVHSCTSSKAQTGSCPLFLTTHRKSRCTMALLDFIISIYGCNCVRLTKVNVIDVAVTQ